MTANYKEIAFESAVESAMLSGGYTRGFAVDLDPAKPETSDGYSRERALFPGVFIAFVKETQPQAWKAVVSLHGLAKAETVMLEDLCTALDGRGMLDVLRHGFKCTGRKIEAAFFKPGHGLNPDTLRLYGLNRLTLTRQVHFSPTCEKSLDLVVALNGLPVLTAELKNPLTGQTAYDAVRQYQEDRDPREKIFEFKKRTLVHFAVDPDIAFMCTKLDGKATRFLPFNLGLNRGDPVGPFGAGNPKPEAGKYATAYVWEKVWQRDALLDILSRFLHLETKEKRVDGRVFKKETMVFPRYHQWDAVRRLEADAKSKGAGTNYLVQHSAGSGKSNSIGWLAHRLAFLHDAQDRRVFDSVVVITDRVILDQQLQETIYQFEHKHGVVEKIDEDTAQLARALRTGVPIIITTLQKFPFVTEQIRRQVDEEAQAEAKAKGLPAPPPLPLDAAVLPGKRYAVIVDEAHSSQSGESAAEAKGVLGGDHIRARAKQEALEQGVAGIDHEEEILRDIAKRGHQPNISFFAFTATPKHKTIKVFGTPGADGVPRAFHTYSMKQAIDEGFILNVLENYTTYKAFFGLIKSTENDPQVEKKEAARALARFLSLHPHNIEQKTEVVVEHFRAHTRHKIGGKAKAMVVTSSRMHAVRYKQALDRYVAKMGYTDVSALVAFSGTVDEDDGSGVTHTESSMNNGIADKEIPIKFDTDEYRVLIAADKFQTGFDQPLLHTMYVDKRLAGIQAVQTLSRLNRTCPGKTDTFILDFWDQREEVKKAFQDYFEDTRLGEEADPQQLYTLQHELDASGIYRDDEVQAFARVFFAPKSNHSSADHAKLHTAVAAAVQRFVTLADDQRATLTEEEWKELKDQQQEGFRGRLQAFTSLFSFLSQVVPYGDSDLTKLYTFGRFLLRALPAPQRGPRYDFGDDVALKYYRLQKIGDGSIPLEIGVGGEVPGPTAVGTGRSGDERVDLSTLIETLNERFGTDFKPADQLFLDSVKAQAVQDELLKQAANANTIDNFKYVFDKALQGYFIDRMEQNEDIFNRFMSDKDFQRVVEEHLRTDVYEQIRRATGHAKS